MTEGSPLSLLVSAQLAALPAISLAAHLIASDYVPVLLPLKCAYGCASQNGLGIVLAGGLGGYLYLKSQDAERAEQGFECATQYSRCTELPRDNCCHHPQ